MINPIETYYGKKRKLKGSVDISSEKLDNIVKYIVSLGPVYSSSIVMFAEDCGLIPKNVRIRMQVLLEQGYLQLDKDMKFIKGKD